MTPSIGFGINLSVVPTAQLSPPAADHARAKAMELRRARERARLSQPAAAELTGLSDGDYEGIEGGRLAYRDPGDWDRAIAALSSSPAA